MKYSFSEELSFEERKRKNPWYEESFRNSSLLVSVAFELAAEKHAGQWREKKDGKLPYITHPVMVCKLLEMFGVKEEIDYAAAILHDVMEDCEPYKGMRENGDIKEAYDLLKRDLEKRMVDHLGGTASSELRQSFRGRISKVADVCAELTNPQHMGGSKRVIQVMDVQRMSDRAKLIKILDQTASIMDDIFFERDVGADTDKITNFAYKALNVVNAASRSNTPVLRHARHFFKGCFVILMQTVQQGSEEAKFVRQNFFPEVFFEHAHESSLSEEQERTLFGKKVLPTEELEHPEISSQEKGHPSPKHGCVSVTLMRDEKEGLLVSGYKCLANDELPDDSVIARSSFYLMGAVEAFTYDRHVDIGDSVSVGQEPAKKLARSFTITPPMPIGEFLAAGQEANKALRGFMQRKGKDSFVSGIIDMRLSTALRDESRAFAKDRSLS